MVETALSLVEVTKKFGATSAVSRLSLTIRAGEIYALLGPNGAGKTTTINMILGFLTPDSGYIAVGSHRVAEAPLVTRSRIAYLPESIALYPMLTGIENLKYFSLLAEKELDDAACRRLLSDAGLQKEAHTRKAGFYSKGMRQKVGVAVAKAKDASLLLLDEPTSGLDPAASVEFYAMLKDLAGRGLAVLMATHDLWRVSEAATNVGILKNGVLIREMVANGIDSAELQDVYVRELAA